MLSQAELCYATLSRAVPCYAKPCRAEPCCAMPCHAEQCRAEPKSKVLLPPPGPAARRSLHLPLIHQDFNPSKCLLSPSQPDEELTQRLQAKHCLKRVSFIPKELEIPRHRREILATKILHPSPPYSTGSETLFGFIGKIFHTVLQHSSIPLSPHLVFLLTK